MSPSFSFFLLILISTSLSLDQPASASTALDASRITSLLGAMNDRTQWQVRVEPELASSNSTLMQEVRNLHEQGVTLSQPVLLAVERQTAGRGRQGRHWLSAPAHAFAASLTASFAWPTAQRLEQLSGLSLVCGLAVREALAMLNIEATLKWPNDVLLDGRKLAGILVEAQERAEGAVLVIGVGINLGAAAHQAAGALFSLAATDLESAGVRVDRNHLAAALAHALGASLTRFAQRGFADFVDAWNAAHAWRDQAVRLIEHGEVLMEGIARGVDAYGRLLLETELGLQRVMVGDVSLRSVRRVAAS